MIWAMVFEEWCVKHGLKLVYNQPMEFSTGPGPGKIRDFYTVHFAPLVRCTNGLEYVGRSKESHKEAESQLREMIKAGRVYLENKAIDTPEHWAEVIQPKQPDPKPTKGTPEQREHYWQTATEGLLKEIELRDNEVKALRAKIDDLENRFTQEPNYDIVSLLRKSLPSGVSLLWAGTAESVPGDYYDIDFVGKNVGGLLVQNDAVVRLSLPLSTTAGAIVRAITALAVCSAT